MSSYLDLGYNNLLNKQTGADFSGGINSSNSELFISPGSIGYAQTTVNTLIPNQNMQSQNFIEGISGWKLYGSGDAQFVGITLTSGVLKYGKTSFDDTSHLGYYISSEGIYFGSPSDVTKLKFQISDGSLAITGALTAGSGSYISGLYVHDLNVEELISGTITSKQITLALTEGEGDVYIASGKTDFTTTQNGFILGIDDSDSNRAKFYIGDSTHDFHWDGSTLVAGGWYINQTTISILYKSPSQLDDH